MVGRAVKPAAMALGAAVWLCAAACTHREDNLALSSEAATPGMASPAVHKCLEDGHALEPIFANSVPIDHLCVDKASGKQCEVWEYFRGNCRLPGAPPR